MNTMKMNFWQKVNHMYAISTVVTERTLSHSRFQQLIRSDAKFDVIVIDMSLSEPLIGLGHLFQAPVVAMSPIESPKFATDLLGIPDIPSYVPDMLSAFSDEMTFLERARNLLYSWMEEIVIRTVHWPRQQELVDKYFSNKDMPPLVEIRRGISLILLNTHATLGYPRPCAPNMIKVGGTHIDRDVVQCAFNTFLNSKSR